MKKLCVILLLLVPAIGSFASSPYTYDRPRPKTEANHSVTFDIPGAEYAYEHPLGGDYTIVGRAGFVGGMAWYYDSLFGDNFAWAAVPVIEADLRYYHSLDRRFARHRNMTSNSGSFLSFRTRYLFPFGLTSDNVDITGGATIFTPGWGFRRVTPGGFLFEFVTGLNFIANHTGRYDEAKISPALNVRLGYNF